MSKEFIKSSIIRPKKFKGMEKGSLSSEDQEKFKTKPIEGLGSLVGADKIKFEPSKMPSASKSEDLGSLELYIKSNKAKPNGLGKIEIEKEDEDESEDEKSLKQAGEKYSKESPKVKKHYEEWLKSRKRLKMMGE